MKALTIWQPWASLIVAGAKPYEFRSWRPPASLIGQRIVIHAAARKPSSGDVTDFLWLARGGVEEASAKCLFCELAEPVIRDFLADELPYAAGIGTAVLGDPISGFIVAERFGNKPPAGGWEGEANWGWPMLEIEAWPEPIPMRGKQGLWNWPTPEEFGGLPA